MAILRNLRSYEVRWENQPSMSHSCMMSLISASVGFWPSVRITVPSSVFDMNPSPSLSNSLNASFKSIHRIESDIRQERSTDCMTRRNARRSERNRCRTSTQIISHVRSAQLSCFTSTILCSKCGQIVGHKRQLTQQLLGFHVLIPILCTKCRLTRWHAIQFMKSTECPIYELKPSCTIVISQSQRMDNRRCQNIS